MSARLDDEILVTVEGALDGDLAPALHAELSAAVATAGAVILVDLTATTALDEGGAAVLAAAAHTAASSDARLRLQLPDGRLVEVSDAACVRGLFRPVDEA